MQSITLETKDQQPEGRPMCGYLPRFGNIQVSNPERHGEGVKDAYVTFDVHSTNASASTRNTVKRRYQDFCWLAEQLQAAYPTAMVPPLPDRHTLLDLLLDRFSPDFIRRRQGGLERFLRRTSIHEQLGESTWLEQFLVKDYLGCEQTGTGSPASATTVDTKTYNSDVGSDDGSNNGTADLSLTSSADILQLHFKQLAKHTGRLAKSLSGMASCWQELATAYGAVSAALVSAVPSTGMLKIASGRMANLCNATARSYDRLCEELEINAEGVFKEYSSIWNDSFVHGLHRSWAFAESAIAGARSRMQQVLRERDYILGHTDTAARRASASDAKTLGLFISQKIDQLKGIDPIYSKQQRMSKLDVRMGELEEELSAMQLKQESMRRALLPEYSHMVRAMEDEIEGMLVEGFCQTISDWNASQQDKCSALVQC